MSSEKTTRPYTLRKRADAMAATRERITEAAMDLHGSVGPSRTTITAVAERAGVQRQTVYRHFATDDDLFAACSGHFAACTQAGRGGLGRDRGPGAAPRPGLDELYASTRTPRRCGPLFRDEPLVPAIGPNLARFRGYLDDAAGTLAAGWTCPIARCSSRPPATPSTSTPGARSGISRADAIELTSAMVRRAAGD